jgi:hypothetical protein
MTTTTATATPAATASLWQTLKQRAAALRQRLAAWWATIAAPAPQPAAAGRARAWLAAAWAWLRGAGAWLLRHPVLLGALVLLALLLAAGALWPRLAPVQSSPPPEQSAAAGPATNPLAPLVARIEAIESQLADLQALPQPSSAARPAQRSAPAPHASDQPAGQGAAPAQPAAAAWGPTDLDRAIADFTPPTTFGATP